MATMTAHGLWRFSKQFLEAADAIKPVPDSNLDKFKSKVSLVAYYLIGHSIELSIKSFLFGRGYDERSLRVFGHDLEKLVKEARRRKLGIEVSLSSTEVNCIYLLNHAYKAKKLEYLEYGMYRLPDYFYIRNVAEKLVLKLAKYAMNKR